MLIFSPYVFRLLSSMSISVGNVLIFLIYKKYQSDKYGAFKLFITV